MENSGTAIQSTDDNIIERKRMSSETSKGTDKHSEYVIIIITFPRLKWLGERSSILSYAYVACVVNSS